MKTQPTSFLSVFIAAIAVPVLVSAAGLSRNLLLNPTTIAKAKGVVVLPEETAKSPAADKVAFDQNPSRYYPQYGGFCANHLRKGELVASDPTVFFVYKGKLYLCADAGGAKEFRSNMDDDIRRADEQWVTHFGFHGNPPLR